MLPPLHKKNFIAKKYNIMNLVKYAYAIALVLIVASCSKNNDMPTPKNETEGLVLVKTITNATHSILVYTENGKLQQGFNKVYLQIKNANNSLVNNATVSWKPLMHMTSMQHSCPYSSIGKTSNTTSLYEGYIVFQMAGNAQEYWELSINYTIDNQPYSATSTLDVQSPAKRNLVSFTGSDNSKYIIALVEPKAPKVALNTIEAVVFKMQDMMTFTPVNNYTIKIDPRMPSMGNHGSPNNLNLTQDLSTNTYKGKLSLTMTGYWKINLQLANELGAILKGEDVTAEHDSSSIFFEIEF